MKSTGSEFVVKFVTFATTRLMDHNGQFHNNIRVSEALIMSRNSRLDLVCFNRPTDKELAFCKILDYNKWLYNEAKKKKKEQKNNKETKEIRLTPNIEMNDVEHKMRQANGFLDDGDDVLLFMKLRGRERQHMREAEEKMNDIVKLCNEHGSEISRKKTGDSIIVRLGKIVTKT